jgi:hypothetical protein
MRVSRSPAGVKTTYTPFWVVGGLDIFIPSLINFKSKLYLDAIFKIRRIVHDTSKRGDSS